MMYENSFQLNLKNLHLKSPSFSLVNGGDMRQFLFLLSCLVVYFSTAHAGSWYVKASGGANFIENGKDFDTDVGDFIGGSLGYRFSRFVRLEAEGVYRHNNLTDIVVENEKLTFFTPIKTWTAMSNVFVDFPCCSFVFPYVGGGAGALWARGINRIKMTVVYNQDLDFEVLTCKIAGDCFAYQGIAGMGVPLGQWGALTVEYRYLNGMEIRTNHGVGMSLMCQF